LVIIGFLGGGGLMLVWEMVKNGDGDGDGGEGRRKVECECGWAELSKCSSAVHQQQQLKNARTRNEKVFGERVRDGGRSFWVMLHRYKQALLGR